MPLAIIGSSICQTNEGVFVTLQVAKGSLVEFADDFTYLKEPIDNRFILAYISRHYPKTDYDGIRLVYLGKRIAVLNKNSIKQIIN